MPYHVHFITGMPVKLPGIASKKRKEIAPLRNGKGHLLNYRHHSIVMNKKKKVCFFSASNINGNNWKVLERKGNFKKDTKAILDDYELGNELYKAIKATEGRPNDFQQGHLTSFQEVIWGNTAAQRILAANDTFYFTNCVPQHQTPQRWPLAEPGTIRFKKRKPSNTS